MYKLLLALSARAADDRLVAVHEGKASLEHVGVYTKD